MLSPQEKERVRGVETAFNTVREQFEGQIPKEAMDVIIGTLLASVDVVFAIRDGESWRGISDPQEIARKLLREAGLGD